ncbi:hypothetical protein WKK05_13400 [Nostoc sp. UHCC 0302]|uniref:hypothetical protein n=1 Tax=Nostoc sp. UHCC 0302 TaxID=3134896 RepID=UPI00311C968B
MQKRLNGKSQVYNQVFDRYLRGLEKQIQLGKSVSNGNGVCFVSFAIDRLDAAINPIIAYSETSFGMMQSRLLYEHYLLCQSERWRSLPKGAKLLRLVWDCTDISPESAWQYFQIATSETVMMLEPSTLERYRKVSLLPTRLIDDESDEQILTSETETLSDEQIDQLVNEKMARSLNAFQQLLDTIEHKRRR